MHLCVPPWIAIVQNYGFHFARSIADEDKPLSAEELEILLVELAGPINIELPPLSDYAVSRESIYEGYPDYDISG